MKFVIALLITMLLLLVGIGGFYYYQQLTTPPAQDASQSGTTGPVIGGAVIPETQYDVMDALDDAISMNSDTVAWLEVPGTEISASVVQTLDNDFYVRRNESKQHDVWGCYFADYECSLGLRDQLSRNTIIYGHSNTDMDSDPTQKRFSQLFHFLNEDFARNTPYLYLTIPEEKTTWEVFAAFYTTTQFDYIRVHITPAQMLEIAKQAKASSVFKYDVPIEKTDKILTLSTCSVKYKQDGTGRFVVMARLVSEEEELAKQARLP